MEHLDIDERQRTGHYDAWLVADGKNVCWVNGHVESGNVYLWTIETREDYRGRGYAKRMIDALKEHFGVNEIMHDGGYTPEGRAFVLPLITRPENTPDDASEDFKSMDFVYSWDQRILYT